MPNTAKWNRDYLGRGGLVSVMVGERQRRNEVCRFQCCVRAFGRNGKVKSLISVVEWEEKI